MADDCSGNRYGLRKLPPWQPYHGGPLDGVTVRASTAPRWGCRLEGPLPPAIGTTVMVRVNEIGSGTVVGYFVEHGFLGVEVRIERPPAWWRKQNRGRRIARVFGPELQQ